MRERVVELVRNHLAGTGLRWAETAPGTFTVTLPGEHKLGTECAVVVADHTVQLRAFVARRPDERVEEVHRWLLQRNLSTYGVAFSTDAVGDIHLTGRVSLDVLTTDELDRLLGELARVADESFDTIVGTGFRTAIEREWRWRLARGEPTANLAAFEHLRPPDSG